MKIVCRYVAQDLNKYSRELKIIRFSQTCLDNRSSLILLLQAKLEAIVEELNETLRYQSINVNDIFFMKLIFLNNSNSKIFSYIYSFNIFI